MDLKIRDVAELLNVSETTIRRWLSEGIIPAYKLHHQYRFSRTEIEDWMMSNRLGQSSAPNKEKQIYPFSKKSDRTTAHSKGWMQFSLYRALHKGEVLYQPQPSSNKKQLIQHVVNEIAPLLTVDPEGMTDMLYEREELMPTALGQGIAVPHTRDFLLKESIDIVCPVFLEKPIEWGALDNQPVHTLFFLFASDDKRHLHLLAKIAHLASDANMMEVLQSRPSKDQLLEMVKQWEQKL